MAARLGQRPHDAFAGIERQHEARDLPGPPLAARERKPEPRERQRLQREPGAAGTQRREPELPQRLEERKRRHERDRALAASGRQSDCGSRVAGAPQRRDQATAA